MASKASSTAKLPTQAAKRRVAASDSPSEMRMLTAPSTVPSGTWWQTMQFFPR